jgi:hypothetical protein
VLASLRADPVMAPWATPEVVRRNSDLIWTWDFLSLALCLEWAPCVAQRVPTADGVAVDVNVERTDHGTVLDPWPFSRPSLEVRCEGRRLIDGRFDDAAWETVEFQLGRL